MVRDTSLRICMTRGAWCAVAMMAGEPAVLYAGGDGDPFAIVGRPVTPAGPSASALKASGGGADPAAAEVRPDPRRSRGAAPPSSVNTTAAYARRRAVASRPRARPKRPPRHAHLFSPPAAATAPHPARIDIDLGSRPLLGWSRRRRRAPTFLASVSRSMDGGGHAID